MNSRILLLFALFCVCGNGVSSFPSESKRQVAAPGAASTAVTESPAEALMRLKLLTYQQKLVAKEAKKKAKVEKKAQKEAAFQTYMSAIATGAGVGLPATGAGAGTTPGVAPAPVPPIPMLPAMGLWKKSFLLSQIMAAAAAQNAAIAAAAAATTTTTTPPSAVPTEAATDDDEDEETETINEIVKRYAPVLRRKFYGVPKSHHQDVSEEDENEDADAEAIPEEFQQESGVDGDEDGDEEPASYQSGSFNKFGTGPAGSPNGVGYEDAKVNQAGCSGSHIHICSGTTVYLTNPDEATNDNPLLQNSQFKAVEPEPDQETEASDDEPKKHGRKRLHSHRH